MEKQGRRKRGMKRNQTAKMDEKLEKRGKNRGMEERRNWKKDGSIQGGKKRRQRGRKETCN